MAMNASFNLSTTAAMAVSPDVSRQVSFRYFGICVASFTIVVGTIGNLLTILAFASNRKIRTTFNVFIVNLSVVDFITSCLMLPFNLAGYVQMQWPFGNDSFTTRIQAYSYFCCGYTSVVFLIAITVNRFVGVVKPGQYRDLFRRNRLVFTLVFCWTFAPICLFPFFIGTDPLCKTKNHALTGFHPMQFVCTFICLPNNGWNAYMQVTRVVFQFLPLAIMIALYGYIFIRMRRKREKLVKSMTISRIAPSLQTTVSASGISHSSSTKSRDTRKSSDASKKNLMLRKMSGQGAQSAKSRKADTRMLFISVAICVGFMITFLPSVIVNLIPKTIPIDPRVHMAASNLTWFNASINPIIYVIMNRRFRKEYIRLVRMLFGQVKGGFVRDSSTTSIKERVNRGQSLSTPATNLIVNQTVASDSPKRV